MVALLVLMTVLAFLTVDYFVQRRRGAEAELLEPLVPNPVALHNPEYRTPMGVFFDPHHTWAFLEESGSALVGVDDLARVVMGRVDRTKTPAVGTKVQKGDPLIEMFHGGRSVALASPFDGVIEEVNKGGHPDTSEARFTADWVCKVRPQDASALQRTMMLGQKASEWLKRETRRLRVFLATVAPEHPVLAQTMHDGGMPYAGLVEYLGDEDWYKLNQTFFRDRVSGSGGV